MIWFLGDSAIRDAVIEFAGGQELLDSSSPDAIPEIVWTEQVHNKKRWKEPITVICYLSQKDYDSEATAWRILHSVPKGSKIIYIMVPDSRVNEGLDHFEDAFISRVVLDSLVKDTVVSRLRAV